MKTAILASLIASAAAFAPAKQQAASSTTTALSAFEKDFGALTPLGYFDPLQLTTDGDVENFNRLRESEVRHGRCAMLAVTGWLTTAAGVRLPGMEDVGFGFKALTDIADQSVEVRGVIPLTLATIWGLTFAMQDNAGTSTFPGDYRNGFIDFGWDSKSTEWQTRKRTIELNNGRAAQMGILGIMVHEQLGNLNDLGLPQP
jgi:Chlorophyll A-B binding protein